MGSDEFESKSKELVIESTYFTPDHHLTQIDSLLQAKARLIEVTI